MTSVYHRLDQGLSQYQIGELAWEGAVWDEKSPGGTTIELDRCPESLLRNALLRLRGLVLTDALAFTYPAALVNTGRLTGHSRLCNVACRSSWPFLL